MNRQPYQPARRWCVTSRAPLRLRCHCTTSGNWLTRPLTTSEAIEHLTAQGQSAASIQLVLGAAILELCGSGKLARGSMLSEDGGRLRERASRHGGVDG